MLTLLAVALSACSATDGDTIRCAPSPGAPRRLRIRLIGIDAPELPGHCRRGRTCVAGDPIASRTSLARRMAGARLTITARFGQDRYGRTLALVSADGGDLSCWQLRQRRAVYVPRWDDARALARTCPSSSAR